MSVELIDKMGTDDSIVNAARVSVDKKASLFNEEANEKLLSYLAKHNHWSPFAHCTLSFRINAPIFVARQLAKHQVGFAWNEVSRRYVDFIPEVWHPNTWRQRGKNMKQGSSLAAVLEDTLCHDIYHIAITGALRTYDRLLSLGVCPEQARAVLPLGVNTQWIWTGSLYGFSRVCKLRTASDTQLETREIANDISDLCSNAFPKAWKALND